MTDNQVIISGGGIAGVGAALMLGRRGIKVTLLEREQEFAEGGYGLQLGPNITRILREEGAFDAVADLVVYPKRLVFRNAVSGEELTHADTELMKQRFGGDYVVLHRNDLLQALVNAAEATGNVTLLTGKKVVDFRDVDGQVTVTTEDGDTYTGRVLVAADGVHSLARKRFVGDDIQPTGYVAYRGTIPIEKVDPTVSLDEVVCWMGPGLHVVQYPVRNSTEYNQVAVFRSPSYPNEGWGGTDELHERFKDMYPSVAHAIDGLSMARGWPMADRPPLKRWTYGRVAFVGDAAHATLQYLAQGAGQSLVDAVSLTRHLVELGDDWSDEAVARAWERYEADRVELGGRVQTTSRWWGEAWHVDTVGAVKIRDYAFQSHDTEDLTIVDWLWGPPVDDTVGAGSSSSPAPAFA